MSIRIHKKLNLMDIEFKREIFINMFYKLHKTFNKFEKPDILTMNKHEFWTFIGFSAENYNSEYLHEIIEILTQNVVWRVGKMTLGGSVFTTKLEDKEEIIKIAVTEFYKPYIFTKYEIDMMKKAKENSKMSVKELDYWKTTLEKKSKELVLVNEATLLKIKTKYGKRLYTLLAQFKKTGIYKSKIEDFRQILEIPTGYTMSHIDSKVLKVAIREIEKKTEIKSIKVNKIKKGRRIAGIEFTFFTEMKKKTFKPKVNKQQTLIDTTPKPELSEIAQTKNQLASKVMLSSKIDFGKKAIIGSKIGECQTIEEIENLKIQLLEEGIIND